MKRFALLLAFLPPAATTLACQCPDSGSPVELSPATVLRSPKFQITGDATLECEHWATKDQCDTLWIVPHSKGSVTFTLLFSDGTKAEDTIEYIADSEYPCRGSFRPVHDHVTQL